MTTIEVHESDEKGADRPNIVRGILYGLLWLIVWPLIIIPVVYFTQKKLILDSMAAIEGSYQLNQIVTADKIFYIELAIFTVATLVIGTLLIIKLILAPRKWLFLRAGARVLGFYLMISVLLTGLAMVLVTKSPEQYQPPPTINQDLASVIESVGGKRELLESVLLYYVDSYGEKNRLGEYMHVQSGEDGSFLYGTITVKRDIDPRQLRTVVAHEYLHHIWNVHLDETTLYNLTNHLTALYNKDTWMQHRINEFPDGNYQLPTELFSLYCTEVPDKYLNAFVLETCNEYIDRSALIFTRI